MQVELPPGESVAAWVAAHAIEFHYDVSTIWAVSHLAAGILLLVTVSSLSLCTVPTCSCGFL